MPRGDTLLVGATIEELGFVTGITALGTSELVGVAARLLPELGTTPVIEQWAGLRPVSPDALPIVGRDPRAARLAYCCGFSRNGVLFGPWIAEQLASLLLGEGTEGVANLGIERFPVGRAAE